MRKGFLMKNFIFLFFTLLGCVLSAPAQAECRRCAVSIEFEFPAINPALECASIKVSDSGSCNYCSLYIYINNKCDKPLNIWTPNTLSCTDDNERCQTLNPGLDVGFWQDLDFFQEAESIHTSETIYITHEDVTHTLTISTDVRFFDGEPIDVEESSGCNSAGRGNHLAGAFLMMAGIILVGRLRRRASKEFVDNYQSPEVL